ncbi:hypothetical protein [Streptomyces sp. NRRL S-1896]|uniref:hypothetical protein n=1 Tax=Streptomyces sp. NRRL S-1896 TaxID=1463893 RepID=UPI00131DC427|nr:hypothetical protein [Streptomyces sp. NRRL S-1896]
MPLPVLVLLAFLTGVAEVFFDSAAQAIVPSPAADRELERANARIVAAQITGTGFPGPRRVPRRGRCGSRFRSRWTRCRSSARAAARGGGRRQPGGGQGGALDGGTAGHRTQPGGVGGRLGARLPGRRGGAPVAAGATDAGRITGGYASLRGGPWRWAAS